MGTRVQNGRLELNIPFYENSGDKLVQIKDENNLEYASNDLLSSCINHTDIISGLSLKSYLNNLIITNGYFYENDKLYMFDDSTHIEVLETEESNINQYDINGTVVGNLVNNNGIVSGFAKDIGIAGYNKLLDSFNTFEIKTKITTGNDITANQIFFCTAENPNCPIAINVNNSAFCLYLATNILKWDIAHSVLGSHTILANTTYYVKLNYDGERYILSYSTDDITYTPTITIEDSRKIASFIPTIGGWLRDGKTSTNDSFTGSIDLNHTYLKVDDKIIWKGLKPINEYNVYYLYDSNAFVYADVEPYEKYKFIGKFRINGNNITYKNPSMDLAESFEHGFIIDEKYGSIGYRIYSDGWKEQWGNNANPVFPIAFEEIPTTYTNGATNVSKIGMTISAGYWNACGY